MNYFEQEVESFKEKLLTMASHAQNSVTSAIKALVNRDDDLARSVEEADSIIDHYEKEVDESAILLLSKAPLAKDLRLITVGLKISHDLERVGDEATTISRRSIALSQEPQLKPYADLPKMAHMAIEMLKDALQAFVNKETDLARNVVGRDKQVDALNKALHRELADIMVQKPDAISRALNLMVISKCLERIADHAKNVAEEIVYLYEAKDIRYAGHSKGGQEHAETADYKSGEGKV